MFCKKKLKIDGKINIKKYMQIDVFTFNYVNKHIKLN